MIRRRASSRGGRWCRAPSRQDELVDAGAVTDRPITIIGPAVGCTGWRATIAHYAYPKGAAAIDDKHATVAGLGKNLQYRRGPRTWRASSTARHSRPKPEGPKLQVADPSC